MPRQFNVRSFTLFMIQQGPLVIWKYPRPLNNAAELNKRHTFSTPISDVFAAAEFDYNLRVVLAMSIYSMMVIPCIPKRGKVIMLK